MAETEEPQTEVAEKGWMYIPGLLMVFLLAFFNPFNYELQFMWFMLWFLLPLALMIVLVSWGMRNKQPMRVVAIYSLDFRLSMAQIHAILDGQSFQIKGSEGQSIIYHKLEFPLQKRSLEINLTGPPILVTGPANWVLFLANKLHDYQYPNHFEITVVG